MPERDDHPYDACPDRDCPHFPCRVWREGYGRGWDDGYAVGEAEGYTAGYGDGYSAGAASAAAAR